MVFDKIWETICLDRFKVVLPYRPQLIARRYLDYTVVDWGGGGGGERSGYPLLIFRWISPIFAIFESAFKVYTAF